MSGRACSFTPVLVDCHVWFVAWLTLCNLLVTLGEDMFPGCIDGKPIVQTITMGPGGPDQCAHQELKIFRIRGASNARSF